MGNKIIKIDGRISKTPLEKIVSRLTNILLWSPPIKTPDALQKYYAERNEYIKDLLSQVAKVYVAGSEGSDTNNLVHESSSLSASNIDSYKLLPEKNLLILRVKDELYFMKYAEDKNVAYKDMVTHQRIKNVA